MRIALRLLVCIGLASLVLASCGGGDDVVGLGPGSSPTWSPDGSQIAFVSVGGICLMDADGTDPTMLLPGQLLRCPSWSPRADRISFLSPAAYRIAFLSQNSIMTIDTDGEDPRAVVRSWSRYAWSERLSWSPDGDRMAFSSSEEGDWQVYVVDVDGGNKTGLSPQGVDDYCPAWSPDGQRIAFDSERDGHPEIYVMNADGSDPVRLTDNTYTDRYPDWSPDGSRIAFISHRDGQPDIYIMNADGSNITRLTDNELFELDPKWSPDGSKIVFSAGPDSGGPGGPDIYVVDVPVL